MKKDQIEEIANAVLYEGYLLYPYRHSAIKNRQRWTFGGVYPQSFSQAHGGLEPYSMHTECIMEGSDATTLDVTLRFLHLLTRTTKHSHADAEAGELAASQGSIGWMPDTWEEGVAREVSTTEIKPAELLQQAQQVPFAFPAERFSERNERDNSEIIREQQAITGMLRLSAVLVDAPVTTAKTAATRIFKLTVHVENTTPLAEIPERHDAALRYSFVSTHTILQAHAGTFISLLEPPAALKQAADACQNQHTYPVLVGEDGERDAMLSSPIILYDYPKIAPESVGALFDGTEIDEILTLRIMALTDEEKAEMRQSDDRTREILERTEALTAEQMMKLHGVVRSLGPAREGGQP